MTDCHPFSKFTKLFNNIIFRSRSVTHTHAHTHTPRQNKDDSAFEQGSNKTLRVIKNKNAISGCHGNQHPRTPGNIVKHATEHKAAKQVKGLFIRLQHAAQCPLVRAQQTEGSKPQAGDRSCIATKGTKGRAACRLTLGHVHVPAASSVLGESGACKPTCVGLQGMPKQLGPASLHYVLPFLLRAMGLTG